MATTVQEFDLIQRIRVENGVPRMVSTTFKVIEGGEDLLSLATNYLKQIGFYDKFEENRTSQYIGYRLNNPSVGEKKYQLIFFPKKGTISISLNNKFYLNNYLELSRVVNYSEDLLARIFVLPSREGIFLKTIGQKYSPLWLNGEITGEKLLYWSDNPEGYSLSIDRELEFIGDFKVEQMTKELSCGKDYFDLSLDTLFPYAWQVSISSSEVLTEFLDFFIPRLMGF